PNANTLMTAASGAITALMGSYIVLYPKEKMRILFLNSIWGVTAWKYLLFWLIVQLIGFIAENATGTIYMISSATHLIGFVFGVITTLVLKEKRVLIREANFYKNTYFDQK
ncbi:rhomboid family intramembrane serine protease, partial [Candidatus Woesebacteria bacterium]|nr:rhomboid family intramembrane serine protease [Candidatus Woesebacteria bacterium]